LTAFDYISHRFSSHEVGSKLLILKLIKDTKAISPLSDESKHATSTVFTSLVGVPPFIDYVHSDWNIVDPRTLEFGVLGFAKFTL